MSPLLKSPCIKVCELDREGYCKGCWRTIGEITRWSSMDPREQRALLAQLGERERRAKADASGQQPSEI